MMTATRLATRNADWGFRGAIGRNETGCVDAGAAWEIARCAIGEATGAAPARVRDFLDSRHGRHFADDVANGFLRGDTLKDAIDAAIVRWMGGGSAVG